MLIKKIANWGWLIVLFALGSQASLAQSIPTPESILGHRPGDDFYLASYDDSLGYFKKLAAVSDKIRLVQVGKTTEGLDWHIAIISSTENIRNLDRYREIARRIALVRGLSEDEARRLAHEGKAMVHIDGGLHSTEVAHGQHTIQLAYDLLTSDKDPLIRQILDNVILVLWFCINPDGQNMVAQWYRRNLGTPYEVSPLPWLYQKYVGHDNNRDGYMNNMIESQVVTRVTVREWFPMVFYNHHQTAPFPARIWIPPFAEPISSNMHPLMWRWTNVFGTAMAAWLDERGMPGSIHRTGFDDWYPGFIDNVNNYRNTVSFLTETALYRYATPHFYTVQEFPKNYQELRKEVFYSSPWEGGWWHLSDAVRYMIGASMSVLDTAARFREQIIYNRYQAGRDVASQFRREPPFAYVIPQKQRDPQTAVLLLEKLQINGIEISQATQSFQANGREYPAGSWVVLMDQPFALLVKELMEVQQYPDLRESPGGAPDLPYDVVGWTLPLQMGVDVQAILAPVSEEIRGKMKLVDKIVPPHGAVEGSGAVFVFDHRSNQSIRAVNRILKAGGTVSVAGKEATVGNTKYEAGAFVAGGIAREIVQGIAAALALPVAAVQKAPDPLTALRAPRLGIYSSWVASIDEGWTRWVLEQYEFPYAQIHNDAMQAGHLSEQYDVLVFAEASTSSIMEGHKLGTIPGEFAGGIGDQGVANLREFIKDGGTLVTLGNASRFAIEQLNLPVKDVLKDLKSQDFFCSGSILKADIRESGHPILFGLTRDPAVFFARNGAFETQRDFKGSALLGYAKDENPLLSGYLLHPEKIQGKIAALDVQYGKGHIILAGFRPQWRGQTHGMYKFFFNSLFYFGSATITPAGMQMAARPSRAADWLKLADAIRIDLEKVFEQNLKFAAARGAQATGEGKRFDELVEKMQATHFPELDELKAGVARSAQQKIDEYKTQLKAALIDMRGKEFSTVKFTLSDLRVQFRLDKLEQEISDLLK